MRVTRRSMAMVKCVLLSACAPVPAQDDMVQGFAHPPNSAKPRVHWMWGMSLVNKGEITWDLEEMAAKGIGGVMIFDLSGSSGPMPIGSAFMSPGFKYDVCNAEVLLTRMKTRNGRIVLPDGMCCRLLVLPDRRTMPVEVLRKILQAHGVRPAFEYAGGGENWAPRPPPECVSPMYGVPCWTVFCEAVTERTMTTTQL